MKLLTTLVAALGLLALGSCSNMISDLTAGGLPPDGIATANSLTTALIGAGQTDLAAVKGNLLLPELGTNDTTVTWSSNNAAVVSASGAVTRQATDTPVVLTATITKNGVTSTKTFTVTVTAVPSDPVVAIADDKATLVDAILKGPNADLANTKGPLTLPTTGPSGTTISWTSDNAAVSTSGAVTRPAAGGTAATVTLTATITKASGTQETKKFTVVVQPISSDPVVAVADDKANLTMASVLGSGNAAATNVSGDLTLPTSGASGTTIAWSSSNTAVISNTGAVKRPAKDDAAVAVTLTATITSGTSTATKVFPFTVKATTSTVTAGLYVAGTSTNASGVIVPGYWKDGVWTALPPISVAKMAFVSGAYFDGTDLYFAGTSTNSSDIMIAGYWKNGTWVGLPGVSATRSSRVAGMVVVGTDVYVAGNSSQGVNDELPGYWKNGTWFNLPRLDATKYHEVEGILADGSDIYVFGVSQGSAGLEIPGYWKNDVWLALPALSSGHYNRCLTLAVVGGHIYGAGTSQTAGVVDRAVLWTDGGAAVELPFLDTARSSSVGSLAISGSDVYVGGTSYNVSMVRVPGYWKNQVWTAVTPLDATKESSVRKVALFGTSFYMVGSSTDSSNVVQAGYWKDGVWTGLPGISGTSNATDIVQVP